MSTLQQPKLLSDPTGFKPFQIKDCKLFKKLHLIASYVKGIFFGNPSKLQMS